jgi:heptosyltransferase I
MHATSSILIVRTSAIGDVIHTFPVLDYLRKRFPHAQIDWVVERGIVDLLSAHPSLSHVIPVDFKKWRKKIFSQTTLHDAKASFTQLRQTHYDLLFDLQGNGKSALVTLCAKAKVKVGFGYHSAREKINLLATHVRFNVAETPIRSKYLQLVQDYFQDKEPKESAPVRLKLNENEKLRLQELLSLKKAPWLMVATGSKWPNKQMNYETLSRFLSLVATRFPFFFLFIYGNEEEKQIADRLCLHFKERSMSVGGLSLPLWQAVMYEASGVVAVDSAALHLCATTSTPSFSIFGPSLASVYKPAGNRHVAVQGNCPYGKTFIKHCSILRTCSSGACIKDLKENHLFQDFCSLFNSI